MPARGFANVIASTVSGLEVGERFYGYWPIGSHLVVQPGAYPNAASMTACPTVRS